MDNDLVTSSKCSRLYWNFIMYINRRFYFFSSLRVVCIVYYDAALNTRNSSNTLHFTCSSIDSLAESTIRIVTCKQTRGIFCEINRTPMTVRFLVFAKIVSLQSNTVAERRHQELKSEPQRIFSLSSFALVLVERGRNFHFSKSQKKFRPADRNGELAKPNMYFAAALITFAAKTPTVNERRPTKNAEGSYAYSLSVSVQFFSPFLSFFIFQKHRSTSLCACTRIFVYFASRRAMRPECEEDSSVFLTVRIN